MVEIRRSTVISATAEALWAVLRDFNGHALWHPAVSASAIEGGEASDRVGAVRSFRLTDGSRIREQLLFLSDSKISFGYCVLEAPVPLRDYVASIRLRPVTEECACLWEWRASFNPPPAERERLVRFVRDDIIEAGFSGMRQFLRGERAGAAGVRSAAPESWRASDRTSPTFGQAIASPTPALRPAPTLRCGPCAPISSCARPNS